MIGKVSTPSRICLTTSRPSMSATPRSARRSRWRRYSPGSQGSRAESEGSPVRRRRPECASVLPKASWQGPGRRRRGGCRKRDRKNRPLSAGPVRGGNPASHGLDKTTADRKTEPRAGTLAVAAADPVELVEYPLEIGFRNSVAFIENANGHKTILPRRRDFDARTFRSVFCRIAEEIDHNVFHQRHMGPDHR